jgi:hypothetical protein
MRTQGVLTVVGWQVSVQDGAQVACGAPLAGLEALASRRGHFNP